MKNSLVTQYGFNKDREEFHKVELKNGTSIGWTRQAVKNKYLEALKRRVMIFDNNFIFRRWISSELCFQYFTNLVLYKTLKSNGNVFMDLTNIEGIERLECITLFTEVAS